MMATFVDDELNHVSTMVETIPAYNSDFEAAGAFIQEQISSLLLKNGSGNKSVQTLDRTLEQEEGYFTAEESDDAELQSKEEIDLQEAEEKLKSLTAKIKKCKDKHKLAVAKKMLYKGQGLGTHMGTS